MTMADSEVALAIIGLGNMGVPMAQRLLGAGFTVSGYDAAAVARDRAAAAGIRVVDSPANAVIGAAGLILMLPDSTIVEAVLHDPGLQDALTPATTVIDMSSSVPARTRALAEELAARGIQLVDAPVSGGVKGAQAGALTVMAGGADAVVARVTPWLEPLGRVVPTGDVGSGHAIKALNNLLSATHLLATSEAMLAGETLGLDPQVMLSVFNGSSGKSGSTENKFPNFILPGTFDSGFALRLLVKDMRIAVDIEEATGVAHALGSDAVKIWERAAADLAPDADHTEIARWVRDQRGGGGS
jgi:3-hydroxyisobutyrate dehydrogenase